jgi:hypothetical protein
MKFAIARAQSPTRAAFAKATASQGGACAPQIISSIKPHAVHLMVAVLRFGFALLFLLPLLLSGRFGAIPSLWRMIRNHFWMTRLLSHRMRPASRTSGARCFARARFGSGSLQISFVPL